MRLAGPVLIIAVVAIGSAAALPQRSPRTSSGRPFTCSAPRVIDGDTLRCGPVRVRLAHIDAPELPGHCNPGRRCTPGDPFASTANLRRLVGSSPLQCRSTDRDRYGREVAFCEARGVDLSCAQVKAGFAVERYGSLQCP